MAINTSIHHRSHSSTIDEISCAVLAITCRRAKKYVFTFLFIGGLFSVIVLFHHHHAVLKKTVFKYKSDHQLTRYNDSSISYAIYSAHTPNGEGIRSYDYAFYLPLTALTWERIGFVSFVVIIGSLCEWENDPTLRLILLNLKERKAVVSFLPTALEHRTMLSQTVRIFGANLDTFPGKSDDYLITSDSDQWPIAKSFFDRPTGKDLVLIHANCCGDFLYQGTNYRMYPMGNIGATVSTWRQIINEGQQNMLANDAESILDYFEREFGPNIRKPIKHASAEWYFDQKLVSIRIAQWINRYGNETVTEVADGNFTRVDRSKWNPKYLTEEEFQMKYDAHLPLKMYLPEKWQHTLSLLQLLFGEDSWEIRWCNNYARNFYATVRNYIEFNE